VRPGVTLSDYLTGVFAAQAATAALYERDAARHRHRPRRRRAAVRVDPADHGVDARRVRPPRHGARPEGNRLPNSAPLDNYPTSDGRYVCIVAGSDANFRRLCAAMGRDDLLDDPRFATLADRAAHGDLINGVVETWTRARTAEEVEQACLAAGVPVAPVYSAADILDDPHMRARRDVVVVDDPVVGPTRQQGPYPRLSGAAPPPPRGAPLLGQHNTEIWCGLVGLTDDELTAAAQAGVI
jgi:crotonobetainyl-CoA:carnitine CoA-transferase CaiB-like acyl-CoA transferase